VFEPKLTCEPSTFSVSDSADETLRITPEGVRAVVQSLQQRSGSDDAHTSTCVESIRQRRYFMGPTNDRAAMPGEEPRRGIVWNGNKSLRNRRRLGYEAAWTQVVVLLIHEFGLRDSTEE
jgi:hypothetical protein